MVHFDAPNINGITLRSAWQAIVKKNLFLSTLICNTFMFSPLLWAERYYAQDYGQAWRLTPTLSYETNTLGNISNAGLKWGNFAYDKQYVELVTNLSYFQPESQLHPDTSFTNLDASVRFGVFHHVNLYVELGIAIDELFVDGSRNYGYSDDYYHNYYADRYRDSSRPDWFVGVGAGWRLDWLSVNLYGRYRYLESLEEQFLQHNFNPYQPIPERHQWFTGLELSVHF
jgi:hypothetical protein